MWDLVCVPIQGRGIGTRWSLRSLPTVTIVWFCIWDWEGFQWDNQTVNQTNENFEDLKKSKSRIKEGRKKKTRCLLFLQLNMEKTTHNQAIIHIESYICCVIKLQPDPQVIPYECSRLDTNINIQNKSEYWLVVNNLWKGCFSPNSAMVQCTVTALSLRLDSCCMQKRKQPPSA